MGTRAIQSPRPADEPARSRTRALRAAAASAALALLLAPYVGMLWQYLAPAPTYLNVAGEIFLDNQDTSEFIAADGTFLIVGLLVGLVCGALGYWRYRLDLGAILGMTIAAAIGALIAREVGEAFGPAPIAQSALGLPVGQTTTGALELKSDGVLLGWPVGVLIAYLSLIAGLDRPARRTPADEAAPGEAAPGEAAPDGAAPDGAAPDGAADGGTAGDGLPADEPREVSASVGAGPLAGEVGARQGRQVAQHDALPAEQRELGP